MRPVFDARKRRLIYVGAGAVALAIPATAVALTVGSLSTATVAGKAAQSSAVRPVAVKQTSTPRTPGAAKPTVRTAAQRGCRQLFTVNMGEGAANLIYSGTHPLTLHDLEVLGYIERCQRNPAAQGFVRGYDQFQARMHSARIAAAQAAAAARARAAQRQQASGQHQQSSRQDPPQQSAAAPHSGASGGWAIPNSVVQCESNGQNLPPNSAGASGYYQIIPSTWQAYGGGQYAGSAYQATAQQQASIASKIWDGGAGASQWVCANR